ncbi:DUF7096 domain-containing protein [Halorussus amylolyticus]|uniref:DUF7096 domain-containing protein n=1 Tax=Halorussus amylolyticus TaxID=1126242 RepID=UPI0010451E34|nr:hypothetical protein [Halorussus amylolyticus]
MSAHRAVLLTLLVICGSLVVAAPTSAMTDASADDALASEDLRPSTAQTDATQDETTENETNDSFGANISSFMQSSAAEIGGAVETGMWSASFNATANRSSQERLVERRTDKLRGDLTDLQERKEELAAEREAGEISKPAYRAQVGQLTGRINALQSAINATESRAKQAGMNTDEIRTLEADTRNLSGPEIAAVARNTTGVGNGPPGSAGAEGNESGPPTGVGEGVNETGIDESANDTAATGSNAAKPPNTTDTNASGERGPPEKRPVDGDSENPTDASSASNATPPSAANDSSEASDSNANATDSVSVASSAFDDV